MTWLFIDGWINHIHDVPEHFRRVHYSEGDLLRSDGHQVSQLGKTKNEIGGDFEVVKHSMTESSSIGDGANHFSLYSDPMSPNAMEHYYMIQRAKFLDISPDGDMWPIVIPSGDLELIALGTTAIARCSPTSPLFSAAAFLGELREGLPRFGVESWKDRTHRARSAGKDYLNYKFGWRPLVSDIRSFANMTKNAKRTLAKYEKEAGKLVHRRYAFESESTFEVERSSSWDYSHFPVPAPDLDIFWLNGDPPELTITRKTTKDQWFEGAFTYYLPPSGWARDEALAQKVLGIEPTPEVFWQLTPWSWAADWVSNAGDYARNVSNFGGGALVMPYGYMMEHKTSTVEYQLTGVEYKSYSGQQSFHQTFTTEVKKRVSASPYGFGIDVDGFTAQQLAILAAIGITRGSR